MAIQCLRGIHLKLKGLISFVQRTLFEKKPYRWWQLISQIKASPFDCLPPTFSPSCTKMILKTLLLLSLLLHLGEATVYYGPLGNAVAVNSPSTYEELEVESFVQFKLHIIRKYEKTREELEVVEPIDNSKSISVMVHRTSFKTTPILIFRLMMVQPTTFNKDRESIWCFLGLPSRGCSMKGSSWEFEALVW